MATLLNNSSLNNSSCIYQFHQTSIASDFLLLTLAIHRAVSDLLGKIILSQALDPIIGSVKETLRWLQEQLHQLPNLNQCWFGVKPQTA